MIPADKIEKAIKQLSDHTTADMDKRTLAEVYSAMDESIKSSSSSNEGAVRRKIMQNKITKFAAAAVIIIAAIIGINHFGGSIEVTSVAFAEIAEAMRDVKWMHQVSKGFQGGVEGVAEQWIGFEENIHAAKWADGKRLFWDINEHKKFTYDPAEKKITIEYVPEDAPFNLSSPVALLEGMEKAFVEQGAEIVTKAGKFKGSKALIQEFTMTANNMTQSLRLYIQPKTKWLIGAEVEGKDAQGKILMAGDITFSYPGKGPKDIYDLDVPGGIEIVNNFKDQQSIAKASKIINGPIKYVLADGSQLDIQEGSSVELYSDKAKRGFRHLQGKIGVQVVKGLGEFVIITPHGKVKALGTAFTMDLVKNDSLDFLAVNVTEGTVELSNESGTAVINEKQSSALQKGQIPYNFRKDTSLPPRLIERIESMLSAIETGDKKAWVQNFNTRAMFDLVKGKIKYADHKDWFSGMGQEDADRIIKAFGNVKTEKELIEKALLEGVNIKPAKIYIRSVSLDPDGKHAKAKAIKHKGNKRYVVYSPQWTYYDNDWWQTDD